MWKNEGINPAIGLEDFRQRNLKERCMKHDTDVSRRKFLQTAASAGVVAGMATVAMPMTANAKADSDAKAGPAEGRSRPEDPL